MNKFWDMYSAPSKACEKTLPGFSSNGGPPPRVARPVVQNNFQYQL